MGLLDEKVILITGAGNGIGREHALACAAEGARIVVNDLGGTMDGSGSDDAAAAKVAAEINAAGSEAIANFESVTDAAGCSRMVAAAMDKWGRLDAIVNNAGILRDVTFKKMSDPQWNAVLDVHLNGTKNVTQAALSALSATAEEHGHCAIINTTSYSGMIGNFGQSNYAAAKAGIYGFTRVLSMELRKYGITANCLAPIAKTRMTDTIEMVEDEWSPAQISPVVVFLASKLSKGVTGRVFGIQGQRIHVYEVQMNDGVEKAGTDLWTAQEIADRLGDITAFEQPEAASSGGDGDVVSAVFAHFPAGFKTGKMPDWTSTIQWVVKGGTDQTLFIKDDACTVKSGLEGTATCTVKTDKDTLIAMFKGELDSTKAFMTGKAVADNMGDLMKMAQVFDFDAIGAAYLAAGGDTDAGGLDPVDEAFSHTAAAYQPDKAGDFACTIHFAIKGAADKTIICGEGKAEAQDGLVGTPDCTISTDAETITGILTNTTDPQKAFMRGKISADNMGVLMKFALYFKFEKPEGAAAPAAKAEAPAESDGPKSYPIGKTYDGGHAFVRPEHAAAYAAATNDKSAAYLGADAIAPHMLHTRLFKDVMFQVATDPQLDLDLLRLVHGEHDATFHIPLKPWDLVQVRARLESVEEKSSGKLVVSKLFGFVEGELAVECRTAYFIKGDKKKAASGEKKAPKAPAPEPPAPDFEATFCIDADQSYRYAEASLDDNPIHVDPNTAKAAGLPDVILHGLCTMAMAGGSVVESQAGGDPLRLKRLGVRFARPVLNSSKLTTFGWNTDKGIEFIVKDDQGNVVIANGIAELG
jgi:NAD(P)-dependent dehydrogenase (short-subunit alcohol dehydrogenase family)/acyl dehydratase/putative sterol carrier protein